MHENVEFFETLRLALLDKLSLKTIDFLTKDFSLKLRYYLERYTVFCDTVRTLKNSDKNGLPTVQKTENLT